MKPEHSALARRSLLLARTPEPVAQSVLATAHARRFDRGSTIFLQGERASAVYIVAEGWVKLYRISPSGTEAVVAVFTKGASFGEAVAFRNDTYPVAAEAVTDCTLVRIEVETLLRHLRENPEIAIAILSSTFAHLQGLVGHIVQLKAQTGAQRVAEFLLELAPCSEGSCEVTLPYDKVLIAGRLGMKPESLSRAFGRLKSLGVSIRQTNAVIGDIGVLRDYVEKDPSLTKGNG